MFTSHIKFWVAIFIFCFPVECGLLHDGPPFLGYCILHSTIVVCSHHSHGLYHWICCLDHYLGYCLFYSILLSCHFRFLLRLPDLSLHISLPSLAFTSWHHAVYLSLSDITIWCLYAYLLLCIYQNLSYICTCVHV